MAFSQKRPFAKQCKDISRYLKRCGHRNPEVWVGVVETPNGHDFGFYAKSDFMVETYLGNKGLRN